MISIEATAAVFVSQKDFGCAFSFCLDGGIVNSFILYNIQNSIKMVTHFLVQRRLMQWVVQGWSHDAPLVKTIAVSNEVQVRNNKNQHRPG